MKESLFQFTNPKLESIEYKLNNGFNKNEIEELSIGSKTLIHKNNNDSNATVSLLLFVGNDTVDYPFSIKLIMSAEFIWDKAITENADELLSINAPTMLLSYARPIIAMLTVQSGLPALNLPFMNFTVNKAEFIEC